MAVLLSLLIGQLIVFGTFACDKQLKKTKQAFTTDNENVNKSDAVFSPPQKHNEVAQRWNVGPVTELPVHNNSSGNGKSTKNSIIDTPVTGFHNNNMQLLMNWMKDMKTERTDPDIADIDECIGNVCQNGATCVDGINQYTCTCVAGYDGEFCQNNINECASHACQNGANCVDGINEYTCVCVAGYDGTFCDNNIDECTADPCTNGGTCVDKINDYTCNCVAGYTDKTCATNINECESHACNNGATCVDRVNAYECVCAAGWEGTFCTSNINECGSHACINGATCVDRVNAYECVCAAGWDGTFCTSNIDECDSDPCQNGGTCVDEVDQYTCNCVPGYNGDECQNNIDECIGNLCENGATCVDDFNECASSPCQNAGTCTDQVNGYVCSCNNGFTGLTCRQGELGDDCSTRADVCDNLANAECDGSKCVCKAGYEDPTGATGSCSRVDCGTITPPTDGAVDHTSEGTDYESKAYFSCNAGYTLTGLTSVTCQTDKSWRGATPTCVIKNCGDVAAILNGAFQYTPNTLYQGVAEFSCNTGYTLVGDATRTCQDTGVWGGANPVCQINADDNDHCSSNPCKNEGTCIEEGDDYSCKCAYHWYSGKNCDKDDGPCKTCSERGTARCVYSGPGGTVTSCVCNAWYKGDKCDYFHDNVKNWLRNATGIDISDDFFDDLVKRIDNGDIQIPTGDLRKAFGDLDDFDQVYKKSGLGKLGSGSIGYIDNVDRVLGKEFGFVEVMSDIEGLVKGVSGIEGFFDNVDLGLGKELGYGKMMSVIEGFKQKLQRQHQQN